MATAPGRPPTTILLVTSDRPSRETIGHHLSSRQWTVQAEKCPGNVLCALRKTRPDLVLVDLIDPESGLKACAEIRRATQGQHLPLLAIVAEGDVRLTEAALEAGVSDCLTRPFHWPLWNRRLRRSLRAGVCERQLEQTSKCLEHTQRIAHLGNWTWNPTTDEWYCSEEATRVLGLTAAKTLDRKRFVKTAAPSHRDRLQRWLQDLADGRRVPALEHPHRNPSKQRLVRQQAELVEAPDGSVCVIGTVQDVTERQRAQDLIELRSSRDSLTGLHNRQQFLGVVERAIDAARLYQRNVAVMLFDLDRFKQVNESLGHQAGDQLLLQVAQRLQHAASIVDTGTSFGFEECQVNLARFGGDEFAMMLPGLARPEIARKVGHRILDLLTEPFEVDGQELFITTSIGISVFPRDRSTAEALLKTAETAMYQAKSLGRHNIRFYAPEMEAQPVDRLVLETALRRALERREFALHYQPRVDLVAHQIVGFEALLRWRHPELGLVSPTSFIPIAEDTDLILDIGLWALREACRQNRRWQREGLPPVRVSVNLSAVQFRQVDLIRQIHAVLAETELPARWLELELTESTLMRDVGTAAETLRRLRASGIHISVDDFGTGYSSLSYLKSFALHALKIDQSFVRDIETDPDDAAITRAIISMAHSLRLQVVAEGVETREQLAFLSHHGCDEGQGFLFGPPAPGEEASQLLRSGIREGLAV